MSKKSKSRRSGTQIDKMDHLYEDLRRTGNTHKTIQEMSLRLAVLERHGTPEAVDAAYGAGFYEGIQQPIGKYAHYRKQWERLQDEKARQDPRKLASIESLKAQIKVMQTLGIPVLEIVRAVQKCLGLRGWILP